MPNTAPDGFKIPFEDHLRMIRQLGLKSFICAPLRSRARTLGALTFIRAEPGRVYDATDLSAAEDLAHRTVIAIENASLLSALKESDRRKDEFLAILAHELRNPLAPIRNAVQNGEKGAAPTGRRILVVDDNRDAADSLGMLLRMMGNEVHTAHDGLEAVGAAAAFQPDVVLRDLGLPKLNGYEAARRIREQDGGTDMVLVAVTGWGQEEDRRRSKEAGFDHHMTKPVEFDALQKLLA